MDPPPADFRFLERCRNWSNQHLSPIEKKVELFRRAIRHDKSQLEFFCLGYAHYGDAWPPSPAQEHPLRWYFMCIL